MSITTDIWLPSGVEEGPAYGTPEWHHDRIGRVTASRFKDVMTEPRSKAAKEAGELSDTALAYLHEVIAQAITGKERVGGKSAAMDRGVDLEADALDYYADTPDELDRCIGVGDLAGIARIAHGLKSTGGNLMARRLRDTARQTDQEVQHHNADEALRLAGELRGLLGALLAESRHWLAARHDGKRKEEEWS